MIILDEPTAALDAIAESEMYNKYAELVCDKTSIFISHRLSSTRFCDQIFFLEDGQIKEIGNHDDLMMLNGSYAKMFAVQSQYYVREDDKDERDRLIQQDPGNSFCPFLLARHLLDTLA